MMTALRSLMTLLLVFLAVSCGSDVEMDNLPESPPPPGQNPPAPQDADNDGVADADDQCSDTPAGENVDENGCADSQKDTDGDGVNDADDQCPDSPAGTTVDENGCEEGNDDGDGDGVPNDDDDCPNTPEGAEVDENGCSDSQNTADADGDGIPDADDDCPNTPEGEEVDENGCSDSQNTADADGDGVPDSEDDCPNTPEGEEVDENGCSDSQNTSDADGDGVPDPDDDCPDTPEGAEVDENGCATSQLDSDGDGVNDDADQCPDTPDGEEVDEDGCSDSQKDDDNDGVSNADDQCPDTAAGATVNEEGCSDAQSDTDPPVVTGFEVTDITPTSFKVEWNLDEGSKGYIRFGTSSGNYDKQTATEEDYLTRHVQTVGGTNPEPLMPGTTYYWQIYVEDEAGNTGFSEEQTATTAEEVLGERTYVPDDGFERFLIYAGYDDVMDDYVLTENISGITELTIDTEGCWIENEGGETNGICDWSITDFTGIEDFVNLERINANYITVDMEGLRKAPKLKHISILGYFDDQPVTGFPELISIVLIGDKFCDCGGIPPVEISNNPKLEDISYSWMTGTSLISNNPSLNVITVFASVLDELPIDNNQNLYAVQISGGNNMYTEVQELSIVNNPTLERLQIDTGAEIENLYIREHNLEYICVISDSKITNNDVVPEVPIKDDCDYISY